ncbi:endonuclease domain-containing protein [Lysinibacter cavernae]|uniref:Very-short-patch-repair endonuclease n=1 Tax=Lysinibacter cavernae TaxID=1640652 RepID=A0A7X5TUU0_9MICO|nr:DUF559 domain-containing protein [Lysinibacter cavernae]NIH54939.1 very-short-patch-repair endonuclease [Lysinibacter cavernae]
MHPPIQPFTVAQGLAAGVTPYELRAGPYGKPYVGLRSVPNPTFFDRCAALLLIMRPDECLSHHTAAVLWGVPLPTAKCNDGTPIHITTVRTGRERRIAGVVGHRTIDPAVSIVSRYGYPTVDPITMWLSLAGSLTHHELVAAADYLVQVPEFCEMREPRPFVNLDRLRHRLEIYRGPGKRRAALAFVDVRVGSDSPMETLLRLKIQTAGLPAPRLNQVIFDQAGQRLGRVDLVYPEWRVIVEYDGDQHRTDLRQYEHDIDREEGFRAEAWSYLRVRARHLRGDFAPTAQRIERALRAGGWLGTSVRRSLR